MKKASKKTAEPEMLPNYDFRGGKRGVYAARFAAGTNIVALSPDVAKVYPDSDAVNKALRGLINRSKPKPKRKVGYAFRKFLCPAVSGDQFAFGKRL